MNNVTVVGGGLAGLVAAISCAERGANVELLEAHSSLGGRARTDDRDFRANLGPRVLYDDGSSWAWLRERKLLPPSNRSPLLGVRFFHEDRVTRRPPLAIARVRRLRGKRPPADESFRSWASRHCGEDAAELLSRAAGVFSFDHDPGRLSAQFIAERGARVLTPPPSNRYVVGGWGALVRTLERRARELGVAIRTGERVDHVPDPPVIIALNPSEARRLLGAPGLEAETTRCALLDLGLRRRRGDPFVVSDLDASGWLERFSAADHSLAPEGHELVQGQVGIRPGETPQEAIARLERVVDAAFSGWRERTVWRRHQVMDAMTGAVDLPGTTWRDRPAVARGDGVYLAGDWVAAPGLLSEVAFASAVAAADGAVGAIRTPSMPLVSATTGR